MSLFAKEKQCWHQKCFIGFISFYEIGVFMKFSKVFIVTVLSSSLCSSAQAASVIIDGKLADWGLESKGNLDDWIPDSALVPFGQYTIEDQTGGSNTYLTPGYGGQAYDAEAMYTFADNSNLYIALVTGLSPNTPTFGNSYGPGDFAIDFGRDGTFEFGIQTTGADIGKVYKNVVWDLGLWDTSNRYINHSHQPANPLHPTSIKEGTGTYVGMGQLIYDASLSFNNMGQHAADYHYVIEAAIPLAVFNGFSGLFDIHWTMNCANDSISVDPELARVPEPTTLALLMLGLTGMAFSKRRNNALMMA
jgi:hypothetical protein